MAGTSLVINILADASDAQKDLKKTGDSVDDLGSAVGKAGKAMALGAAAGAAGLVALGVDAFNAAAESQKIARETERVLRTTGAAAWTSVPGVTALAGAISDKTGADDEAIQSGANLILTFTKVKNEVGEGNNVFDRATEAALDMSTALGTDMSGASIQLGKALNDPIKGLTALAKAGVSFTEDQKTQIRLMQESGDLLGAQKIILGEVETEFKGAAEAAGTPLDKLRVTIGNFQEDVGAKLIPPVMAAADVLVSNFVPALDAADTFLSEHMALVQALATTGLVALAGSYAEVIATQGKLVATNVADFFVNIGREVTTMVGLFKIAIAEEGVLRGAMTGLSLTALPATAALAALSVVVYGFASAGEEGAKAADKFTQSLDVPTGNLPKLRQALKDANDHIMQLSNQFPNWTDRASEIADVIIPFHDVEGSAGDARGEIEKIRESTSAWQETLDKSNATTDLTIKKLTDLALASGEAAPNVDQLRVGLEAIAQAKKIDLTAPGASDQLVALFNATTKTSTGVLAMTDAQEKYNDAAATAKDKTDAYKQSLDALTGAHLSAAQAETNFSQNGLALLRTLNENQAAIRGMADQTDASAASSLEHANIINTNNKAIQDNVKSALDLANATYQEKQGQVGNTEALRIATAGLSTHRDQLIATMIQMGYNEVQAKAYIDRLGLTPANINTQMNLDNSQANAAVADTQKRLISASGVYTPTMDLDISPMEKKIREVLKLFQGVTNEASDRAHQGTGRSVVSSSSPGTLVAAPLMATRAVTTPAPIFNINVSHTGLGIDNPKIQRDIVGAITRWTQREGSLRVPVS